MTAWLIGSVTLAAVCDWRTERIPNWVTLPTMAAGVLGHAALGGTAAALSSLAGLSVGFLLLLVFHVLGGMGAGDVKLLAAVGAVVGPAGVVAAFVWTALIGGLFAVCLGVRHWGIRELARRLASRMGRLMPRHRPPLRGPLETEPRVRYGMAIAAGTLLSQWSAALPASAGVLMGGYG